MDYFLLSQDNRVPNPVEPLGVSKALVDPANNDGLSPVPLLVKSKEYSEYVDFIARPLPLVSERLKQLLQAMEKAITFIPVVLTDLERGKQQLYWGLYPPKVECLSPDTQFNKNGTIKELVLKPEPIAAVRLFQVDRTMENFIVANLIVVESILRRKITGLKVTGIKLGS